MKLSRRSFLKNTTAASAGAVLSSGGLAQSVFGNTAAALAAGPGNKWPGRVAIVFNKDAVTRNGTLITPIEAEVKKMFNDALLLLTGETAIPSAWKAIFPASLSATSKICIKTNLLNGGLSVPSPFTVKAIYDGLLSIDFNGSKSPASNITIYDMNNGTNFANVGYTTTLFPNQTNPAHTTCIKSSMGSGYTDGARSANYASVLHDHDFLINVFNPRGHSDYAENFTLGFKSHYGTYAAAFHDTTGTPPYLRDINCIGAVYNKTVLSVCSAIYANNEGNGPTGGPDIYTNYAKTIDPTATLSPTTTMVSTDPVSIEMQAIKMMRLNKSPAGSYGISNMPKYLRASAGVTGALADATYNIGVIDETKMDIRRIINGSSATRINGQHLSQNYPGAVIVASQINGHSTFVEFALPENQASENASIEISTMKGALVWKSSQKVLGVVNHFAWDHRDAAGVMVRPGIYVVRISAGTATLAAKFSIAR